MPILCRSASWYQKLTAMHIKIRIMTTPIWNCAAAWFTNENLNDPSSRSSTAPSPWSSWLFNDPLQCIVNQDLFAATVRGAKSSHRSALPHKVRIMLTCPKFSKLKDEKNRDNILYWKEPEAKDCQIINHKKREKLQLK